MINQQIHADTVYFAVSLCRVAIAYAGSSGYRDFDNPIAQLTWNVLPRFADPMPFVPAPG